MIEQIIYNISIVDFRRAWARYLGNRAQDPTTMTEADTLTTCYMIWAREHFSFTHLKVIQKRGSTRSGYVLIEMPVSKLNYKKHYMEILANKVMDKSLG